MQSDLAPDGEPETGFAPSDPLDDRETWDWKSRWEPAARKQMGGEAIYLASLLVLAPGLMTAATLGAFSHWLDGTAPGSAAISQAGAAWLGGTLGGTIFGIKWLYHTAAKGSWNQDRRLWRLLTPHVSGGLACAFALLAGSGLVAIFDRAAFTSPAVNFAFGFVVGYFSDSATAKLAEIAEVLFGTNRGDSKRKGNR